MATLDASRLRHRSPPDPPNSKAAAFDEEAQVAPRTVRRRWTCARLWLRIQADAFLIDPLGYLQAVAWRARGLRVRSRNRIATLAGRSPYAYPFWIACREPRIDHSEAPPPGSPGIVPIVDCRRGSGGLEQTLASLPPGCKPVIIGDPATTRADAIRDRAQVAGLLDGGERWLCPVGCGDELAPGALTAYAQAAARNPGSRLIYADDDLLDAAGRRTEPHFKPDWNPDLFEHHDFITGAAAIRVDPDWLGRQDGERWTEQLTRRALERGAHPLHLPLVLHHRRRRPEPVVPDKPADLSLKEPPTVTIIVPTRNRSELLGECLAGVERTDYPKLQLIVVDNESDEPETIAFLERLESRGAAVIRKPGPFNYSALNNAAVRQARGEMLCFLNNDVEMLDADWLALLVRQAVRPELGAVGARLLYPDGSIQHAGVFTGIGGGAAHAHRFLGEDEPGYFQRARLPQRVSAVTGACLVVAREKFLAVGGFEEEEFPVAFNDVDLCLKLNARGWQSFYEPRAVLIHHESKSRGSDRAKANRSRFADELAALKRKWRTDQAPDPFHHPHLSPFCEQFLVAV